MHRNTILALTCLAFVGLPLQAADEIKVCVVAILVSDKDKNVDERLLEFKNEIQKVKPNLTSFKVGYSNCKSIPMGETKTFDLVDKQTVEVTVNATVDENGRVVLTIKPPDLGHITYTCSCNRYFTIATKYYTKDKEQLFIAVMGKPCAANAAKKP